MNNENKNPADEASHNPTATAQPEAFDLADTEDVSEAEVQLKRNGAPIPVWVTMAGPEHPKRKAFAYSKQRKMRKQLAKTGKVEFNDPTEDESEEIDLLGTCLMGWRGVVFSGVTLDCTKDNIAKLLSDPKRAWFRRSVREAFDDGEVFIKSSANN